MIFIPYEDMSPERMMGERIAFFEAEIRRRFRVAEQNQGMRAFRA